MSVCFSTKNLSKRFGSLLAVSNVSFEVNRGEIFGIAGPNGAGKTTLFNMMSGIPFHPDKGEIWFEGKRIDRLSAHKIYQAGLSRTFQQEIAFDSLKVEDNLRLACHYAGTKMSKTEESESISVALEITALNDFRGWLARDLPFFEKKRLMFATAIASRPKLLMLDEPAAGLSHEEGQELIEVVKKLKESEITIIIIEHVLPILFGVSDRLMILDAGEVVIIDTPEVVAKDSKVIAAYLGERRRDKRP